MKIESGQDLLHYHLIEKIGEGGMGVVWRAKDTTLGRDVAIKILPEGFAAESERLGRFEREAKLLASLNHPNIAGIFGLHQAEGHYFLSMELIEGEDLQQRLGRGSLPRKEALKLALQITEAFEAAHEQGVIHRDLKPANVKLTPGGQIKVLDFGLAKALSQDSSDPGASPSMSPTLTSTGTIAGTLLGTAAYMSPEQAKGKAVDRRADIWSFGVLLYEMLTGRRLFEGETISETLAAVILKEIDLGGLPGDTPQPIRALLERCLERDPNSRLRDIGEARVRIEEALSASPASMIQPASVVKPAGRATILPWAVAALALVALGWLWLSGGEDAQPEPVLRFTMSLGEDQSLERSPIPVLAISPDGTKIAYIGNDDENREEMIFLRHTHQSEPTMLKGTEESSNPFFSPDGSWIGFFSDGKLKKISILGGPPSILCDARRGRGASWGTDGTILFTPDRAGGIARVSEAGGEAELLTLAEAETHLGAPTDRWPQYLPGNEFALLTHSEDNGDYTDAEIQAISLSDLSRTTLIKGGTFGRYVHPGFLVFLRERTLFAARFNPKTLEVTEPAVPVLEGVAAARSYGSAHLTVSSNGTMLYVGGSAEFGRERLIWLERDGTESSASEHQLDYGWGNVSPNGTHIALEVISSASSDIWVLELARDTMTRLTFEGTRDSDPIWDPDGQWLTYSSMREGESARNLYRIRADGTGEPERLMESPHDHQPGSWAPDGSVQFFMEDKTDNATDLMTYRPGGEGTIEPYLETKFGEWLPDVSPDGQWLLYASNRSDQPEVYVRATDGQGQAVRVSTGGSPIGRWMPNGNELIYRSLKGKLLSVRYAVKDGVFKPELPEELFDFPAPPYSFIFDVAPDGRILNYKEVSSESLMAFEPVVVANWDEELEVKVPQ